MKKRFINVLLSLTLAITMMPVMVTTSFAGVAGIEKFIPSNFPSNLDAANVLSKDACWINGKGGIMYEGKDADGNIGLVVQKKADSFETTKKFVAVWANTRAGRVENYTTSYTHVNGGKETVIGFDLDERDKAMAISISGQGDLDGEYTPTKDAERFLLETNAVNKNKVKLSWNNLSNAKQYIVYGTKCGKMKYNKIATVKANKSTYTVKKVAGKKLRSGKAYKFYIIGKTTSGNVKSSEGHVVVAKKVKKTSNVNTFSATIDKSTLIRGGKANITVTYTTHNKKKHLGENHGCEIRYYSSNPNVVSVNGKGEVTAIDKGYSTICIQDISGKSVKIKVKVVGQDN